MRGRCLLGGRVSSQQQRGGAQHETVCRGGRYREAIKRVEEEEEEIEALRCVVMVWWSAWSKYERRRRVKMKGDDGAQPPALRCPASRLPLRSQPAREASPELADRRSQIGRLRDDAEASRSGAALRA
jgi:hypothetical protein